MLNKPQNQKVDEGGVAVQAAGNVENLTVHHTTNHGLTVEEVRAVATDAFRADFFQLLGQAGDIATSRAHKVIEDFLERLQKENPTGLQQAETPSFRYALLTAQRAYARVGDDDLEKLLVDLLVERSKQTQRSMREIVLSEALEIVERLTPEQISLLSVSFLIRRTQMHGICGFETWLNTVGQQVGPFIPTTNPSSSFFSHMVFTGCGEYEVMKSELENIWANNYPGAFQSGFSLDDPEAKKLSPEARLLLRKSSHKENFCEVIYGTEEDSVKLIQSRVSDPQQQKLLKELANRRLSNAEIRDRCVEARPGMENIFNIWRDTDFGVFYPSSVGIAIAHSYLVKKINIGDLSIWID